MTEVQTGICANRYCGGPHRFISCVIGRLTGWVCMYCGKVVFTEHDQVPRPAFPIYDAWLSSKPVVRGRGR